MKIKYKNYELFISSGKVLCITLNDEEVGANNAPDMIKHTNAETTLEDAIQWIEEDIKCRKEETPDIYYLEEGDELTCDCADVVVGKNDILCFNGYRDDTNYYYEGLTVEFDDDGKPYVER
jgi:hypothetical protein